MKYILEADSIFLEFGQKKILSDIYLRCEMGKITGLLGRNGAGKSCLLDIISGKRKADSSSVRVNNAPIEDRSKNPRVLLHLPQYNFIPGSLSLQEVFDDFGIPHEWFSLLLSEQQLDPAVCIRNLSGGQRRFIETCVILKAGSRFALLDEPFSHLSPLQIGKVKEMIISERTSKGFLITDHMYRDVFDICDEIYVLSEGKLHLTKHRMDIERLGYLNNVSG